MPKRIVLGKIVVDQKSDDHYVWSDVYNEGDKFHKVHVVKRKKFMEDVWEPAEVNWSALGSCEPDEAKRYAKLIEVAADEALGMNLDFKDEKK